MLALGFSQSKMLLIKTHNRLICKCLGKLKTGENGGCRHESRRLSETDKSFCNTTLKIGMHESRRQEKAKVKVKVKVKVKGSISLSVTPY